MRREILLLEEMIDAAEEAERLLQSITTAEPEQDRMSVLVREEASG